MKEPDKKYTDFLVGNFFEDKPPGFFIEAGANTGYAGSVCWHLENDYGWSGMNIECNPHCFAELEKNRPNCINVSRALSAREEELVFTFPIDGPRKLFAGQGSVVFNRGHWGERPSRQITVKSISLRELLTKHDIKVVDLLVLDVEGHELSVLAGLNGSKVMPAVIAIEDSKIDVVKLDSIMEEWGYKKFPERYEDNKIYYDNMR